MFIGEYLHILDSKGRLALPTRFRKDIGRHIVVTKGIDKCLWVFTKKEWDVLAEKLAKLPISQSKNRSFARLMLAGAMDLEIDSQGRVNVPQYLLEFAGLKKSVVVAGLYNRLEMWDEKSWDKYKRQIEKDSTKVADSLSELGI